MSGGLTLRMGLAALASGSAAGLVATLSLFLGVLLIGSPDSWWEFAMLGDWLPLGFGRPAFFAGAGP